MSMRYTERGLSLIEILVALTILSVGLLGPIGRLTDLPRGQALEFVLEQQHAKHRGNGHDQGPWECIDCPGVRLWIEKRDDDPQDDPVKGPHQTDWQAHHEKRDQEKRTHRAVVFTSMGVATASYLLMLFGNK